MLKTYVMIENFHILLIVNQINQLFDENMKIVKIDTNIELLTMQTKLNMIIKNQFKLITKSETTKTAQNSKKSQTINLQTINFIKSFQIKSSNYETFKSTEIFSNFSSIKSSIVFIVFIITAKHAITNSKSWTQVINRKTIKKIKKINMFDMIKKIKIDEKTIWKNRRIIMISAASINQINWMKYRNKINDIFKKINIHDVLIIAAEMFKMKHFIIFTVIKKNITNQLIQNRIAWKKQFQFSIIYIDETWRKFLIHEIKTIIFENSTDMKLFQNEVETFNQGVKLIREPQWLIKPENRQGKIHSSIKIAVRSQNEADQIKRELVIAKKMLKIIEFFSIKSTNQCMKCMKFEHIMIYCRQSYYSCKWCEENHENRQHLCFICKLSKSCSHESSKCVNCNRSHAANNKACEHFRTLFIRFRENHENELWLKNQKFEFCNIMLQNQQTLWYRVWNMRLIKKLI